MEKQLENVLTIKDLKVAFEGPEGDNTDTFHSCATPPAQ